MTTPDGTGATAPEPTEATANIVEQATTAVDAESVPQIGRASCRERV